MFEVLPGPSGLPQRVKDDTPSEKPDYLNQVSRDYVPPQILLFLRGGISNAEVMSNLMEGDPYAKAALVGHVFELAKTDLQDLLSPWSHLRPVSLQGQAAIAALHNYLDSSDPLAGSSHEHLGAIREALESPSEVPPSLTSKQDSARYLLAAFILLRKELAKADSIDDQLLFVPDLKVRDLLDVLARACLALDLEDGRATNFAARYLLDGEPELFEDGEHGVTLLTSVAFFRRIIEAHLVDEKYEALRVSLRQLEQRAGWIEVLDWIAERMNLSASDPLLINLYHLVAMAVRDDIRRLSDGGRCVFPVGWFADKTAHSILAVVGKQFISLLNSDLGTLAYHLPCSSGDFVRRRIDFTVAELPQDHVEAYVYRILHLSRHLRDYNDLPVDSIRESALEAHYKPLQTFISSHRGIAAHGTKVSKIPRSDGSCSVGVLKRLLKYCTSTSDYAVRRVEIKLLVYTLFQPWLRSKGLAETAWQELTSTITKLWYERSVDYQTTSSSSSSPDTSMADLSSFDEFH